MKSSDEQRHPLQGARQEWGSIPADHYGYASDEERLEKRGMDDWEMVEHIPESQKRVPKWFAGVIVGVLIVAFGLSLPFWGDRPGHVRPWFTMGHLYALLYCIVVGAIIYFMTTWYGSGRGERLDSDAGHDDIDMPGHAGSRSCR